LFYFYFILNRNRSRSGVVCQCLRHRKTVSS